MQIVIAWTLLESHWDGQPYRKDLGTLPGMVAMTVARAVMC